VLNRVIGLQKKKKKKTEGEGGGEGGEGDEEASQSADTRVTVVEIATGQLCMERTMRK
jgi:hypothetical protein